MPLLRLSSPYWPLFKLGLCVVRDKILGDSFGGFRRRSFVLLSISGRGRVVISSNDCAYQSWTLLIGLISFRPSGRLPSSWTRCAKRMGSSSERNCEARKRVPDVDNQSQASETAVSVPTSRWLLSKLNHLLQTDPCCGEASIVTDGAHQSLRRLPRHPQ